jgi:hypothetical protein
MSALPTGIYTFDLNMADGDTVANNTVNVSDFTISDTLLGSLFLSPGASGTLASLTLPDDAATDGMSDANQQFSHTSGPVPYPSISATTRSSQALGLRMSSTSQF